MALQDGFKVLNLDVWDGGRGFATETGSLTMRAPGSHSINVGSGFAGRYYVSEPQGWWSSSLPPCQSPFKI